MAEKKAPTREQRKRASWLQSRIDDALADGDAKCWDVIDTAWNRATRHDTQTRRVTACLSALRTTGLFLSKIEGREGFEHYEPAMVLRNLIDVEPVFADVNTSRARAILNKADLAERENARGGNGKPGPWNALARLALTCGALGCTTTKNPDAKTIAKTIDRWKKSGARIPRGGKKTA